MPPANGSSVKQSEITFTGHAIECRVNAEDPDTFRPSPGVIHAFSVPGGPACASTPARTPSAPFRPTTTRWWPKVIVHGRDRRRAIARMRRTLEMTVIEGISTSIPLHLRVLADADFQAGAPAHLHGPCLATGMPADQLKAAG